MWEEDGDHTIQTLSPITDDTVLANPSPSDSNVQNAASTDETADATQTPGDQTSVSDAGGIEDAAKWNYGLIFDTINYTTMEPIVRQLYVYVLHPFLTFKQTETF